MIYVLMSKTNHQPIEWAVFDHQPIDPEFGYWIVQGE